MANTYFQFRQFTIHQDQCAMKVTTDGCLFGAWVATCLQHKNDAERLLDIGTGSGLLSLMVHQQQPACRIDAVEIDPAAFAQAKANVESSGKAEAITVYHSAIQDFVPDIQYDYIFSNPPFYENELKGNNQQKNLAHHHDGLRLPDLLKLISRLLKKEGRFYLLLPYKRKVEIISLLKESGCQVLQWIEVKPASHLDCFRILIEAGFGSEAGEPLRENELYIKNESGEYSVAFTALLKPYYLYL